MSEKQVTACCGRDECGGECGTEWRGMVPAAPPQHPILSYDGHDQDERTEGVHLLEWSEDSKTTAQRRGDSWRITEWETHEFDAQTHWFPRWFHTIPDSTVRQLAALIDDEET